MTEEKFDDRVAQLSRRRQLLLERLSARQRREQSRIEARPAGIDRIPLSPAQEQLWFIDELAPGQPTYNLVQAAWLSGALDVAALSGALDEVVRRHEALRTVFRSAGGAVEQWVRPAQAAELARDDVSHEPEDERRDAALRRIEEQEVHKPFDLRTGPLFRARLVRLGAEEHAFALAAHHSVVDGWSMGVIIRELGEAYATLSAGTRPAPGAPVLQYPDYARWQHARVRDGDLEAGLAYWQQRLTGLPTLELPADRRRPPAVSFAGAMREIPLDPQAHASVQAAAKDLDASPFMVVVAAFGAVLARWTGATDLSVGTAFSGRTRPEMENTVGFFANMGVLRVDASGDPSFATLVQRVRETYVDALSYQDVPFEQVVQRIAPPRDPSRNPLFQVAVQMLDATTWAGPVLPGLGGAQIPLRLHRSRFDLTVSLVDQGDRYAALVEYSTDLFDEDRIRRLVAHVQRMLIAGPAQPERRLSRLPLLDDAERAEVLAFGVGPRAAVPAGTVLDLIDDNARAAPGVPAVRHGEVVLSYAEVTGRARDVAGGLAAAGVRRGDRVAVLLDRGADEIIVRLGIWYAGAAHVPLDTGAPPRRLERILGRIAPAAVITDDRHRDRVPGVAVLLAGALESAVDLVPDRARPKDVASVLHTSGSTGDPKGVPLDHRSFLHYLAWTSRQWPCGPGDRVLHAAAPVFDMAAGEILAALAGGATMVVADKDVVLSPGGLAGLLAAEEITHAFLTPSTLALVETDPAALPRLRHLLLGGETLPPEMAARWATGGRRLFNVYGPTEATVVVTAQDCSGWTENVAPPIGRPMTNRLLYLVDRWDNPVPVGVPGEILLGGAGIAPGYLDEPELTGRRFTTDPFDPAGRVYRTGDFGAWDSAGRLRFRGRIDGQVKLRGLRIELDEIEAALSAVPGVSAAAATVRTDSSGVQVLVGYVTVETGTADPAALRAALGQQLPPHMIPGRFVTLASLPLTATGKIDRRALPPPADADQPAVRAVAPATAAERQVAAAFQAVLGRAEVGRAESFFDLGGHSLQAAHVLARVARDAGVAVSLKDFYAEPTVRAVARAVQRGAAPVVRRSPLVDLKAAGTRPRLFCPHAVSGSPYWYLGLSRALHAEQPLSGFEAPGLEGEQAPIEDLTALAGRYVQAMRERQPDGPYLLAGWSMGGFLCFEMARQLEQAGQLPALVMMIDSNEPGPLPVPPERQVLRTFVADLAGLTGATPPQVPPDLADPAGDAAGLTRFLAGHGLIPEDVGPDFIAHRYAVFRANMRAIYAYRPHRYDGPVVMVQAAQEPSRAGWQRYAPGMQVLTLPGTHYSIWSPALLPALASAVEHRVKEVLTEI